MRWIALHVARALGVFSLAQFLTRRQLRILCFHGFSAGDEHELAPHVFMRPNIFERRLQILKKRRLAVIPLDEAVQRLKKDELCNGATVITFDDGWKSNLTIAAPILRRFGYPASVYVTTDHLDAGTVVFNVMLYYMLCRTKFRTFALKDIHSDIDGLYEIGSDPDELRVRLSTAVHAAFPNFVDRQKVLYSLAEALGMKLESLITHDRFQLLSRVELQQLHALGFDIQLHTHTHHLPRESFDKVRVEIEQNKRLLEEILGKSPNHFCYPSGEYTPEHLVWLAQLGISSATTCEPGLNAHGADVLQLRRYLDSDATSEILFEAQVCGLPHLVQTVRRKLARSRIGRGHSL